MKKTINRTNNKLISIIIPVYNCEDTIIKCVDSVKKQTYDNIEIILVDDGSIDNSGKICDQLSTEDNRIKVFHKENNGPSSARNRGIKESGGDFIFFLDSDDHLEEDAILTLVEYYNKNRCDIVVGDFKIIRENNSNEEKYLFMDSRLFNKKDIIEIIFSYLKNPKGYSMFTFIWAKLLKSSIIKENNIHFNEELRVSEDILFNINYLRSCESVFYLKKHIYNYITSTNPHSAGTGIYNNPLAFKDAIKRIGDYLSENHVDEETIKKHIGNAYVSFAIKNMVLLFKFDKDKKKKELYNLIKMIISDPDIRKNLKYYTPINDNSRIMPMLIRLNLIRMIMLFCRKRANK